MKPVTPKCTNVLVSREKKKINSFLLKIFVTILKSANQVPLQNNVTGKKKQNKKLKLSLKSVKCVLGVKKKKNPIS